MSASNSLPVQANQQRPRRQQIAAACKSCQTRKGKCDGQRPCAWCRDKSRPCEYEVLVGETRMRATKRKYEDLEEEHTALLELIDIAALRSDARDILQQLKRGRKVGDLLGLLKEGDITYQANIGSSPRTRRMLLSLLIQSTASLDEIILTAPRIAEAQLDIAWDSQHPGAQTLKDRTIDASAIISAVESFSAPDARPLSGLPLGVGENGSELSNANGKRPLVTNNFLVPAQPWTKLTTDDALVSHLVTVFLNYPNVYWRYVEEDLFLHGMQRGIANEYCSPFLVNAVCALACLSSEHSAAFLRPDDLMSRGEHFHNEALRLWLLEGGKASVTNIQALVISSMGAGFRGKDKLGISLLAVAVQMNKDLPFPPTSAEYITMSDRTRARMSASWTAHHFDSTQSLGLLRTCTPIDKRLSMLPNYSEGWRLWTGEPFLCTNVYFRPNALMRERCQLVRLTAEVDNLVFAPTGHIDDKAAKALMERLEHWYSMLPLDLQFNKDLPAPVYELHGHYYCALMTLRSYVPALQTMSILADASIPSIASRPHVTSPVLHAVLETADLLRSFRQKYGFKSSLAFIFQAAALVSSILLSHLGSQTTALTALANGESSLYSDLSSAFDESYRCLLAIGTRVMIGRGVARMVYHSSRAAKIPLPPDTQRLLDVVNEIVWTSTDVQQISSSFPNWALAKNLGSEESRMESMLKQWEGMSLEVS